METNKNHPQVTLAFNIVLFIYLGFLCVQGAFLDSVTEKTLLDSLLDASPAITLAIAAIYIFIVVVVGAKILQLFWERFVVGIFTVRPITFQEGISVILIFEIFTI